MSAFYELSAPPGDPPAWPDAANGSCAGGECALLAELGPPPDMILTLPPPPLPAFLAESAPALMNQSCGLCQWAGGGAVDFVEMPRPGPAIDDTWFFVIICACVGLTLFGILLTIFCLRLKEQKKSRLGLDAADKTKPPLGPARCEAVLYPSAVAAPGGPSCRASRALWAGLRTHENHYTIEHAQPVQQKAGSITASSFEFPDDYSSVGYTTISPQAYRAGIPEGVHILPAHDNSAYAAAADEAVQVTRVAPDGCVVTASPRPPRATLKYHYKLLDMVGLSGVCHPDLVWCEDQTSGFKGQ
ncbi:uncharacterized protein LOC119094105 [Pollicipes pollicipes]|uniref:uncharacterized protein LOC119094105 n=1 Tax=Pollicipes pollicipes TaxID=41117 RepID=UPI00188538FB|nr:uncharacterized protein LOC119094105 [Pollicipes pollicipes]